MNNYYAFAAAELLQTMSEDRQKMFYEGLSGLLGKKKGETEERPQPAPYERNETMRMIGRQNICGFIDNREIEHGLKDIVQARGYEFRLVFDVVFDAFLYGCIEGKRKERAKKKATAQPTKVKQ